MRISGAEGRPHVFLDLEEGKRLNAEGMKLLERQRLDEAERAFRASIAAAPLIPAAHNNLALTAFVQGRIEEAIRIQQNILEKVPIDNLFGMCNLVHFYLTAGRVAEAEALADDILRRPAHDCSAIAKQCETLARLGRHKDILDAVRRYKGDSDAWTFYFAGIAAANLGLYDRALDYLQRVGRREMLSPRAARCLNRIKAGYGPDTIDGNWPYFEPQEIMPLEVFDTLLRRAEEGEAAEARLMKNPILIDMITALFNMSGGTGKDQALIELLGRLEHPRAADLLRRIAEGTFGSDDFRLSAVRALAEKGLWNNESSPKVWIKGQWTHLKPQQMIITTEAETASIPEDIYPLYEKALLTLKRRRWEEGEKLWRDFLVKAPQFQPAYHNLAVALIQQGRDSEAETLLRKAMELDPSYLFAPSTLAVLYVRQARIEEARALLDAIVVPDKVHPAALGSYFAAQVQVAAAEGNMKKATSLLETALQMVPDDPAIMELRKDFKIARTAGKTLAKMNKEMERLKLRRRRRVLSLGAPLADCYGAYSETELLGMARAIGLELKAPASRSALSALCEALGNRETVRAVLQSLRPEEAAAFREVADAGGRMDYEIFTRAHGADADDEFGWHHPPQSLLGRLKCLGLLVEATVDRRPSVFIPSRIPYKNI
jgi:tetratricopeptide (TPR) repeat protein